MSTAAAAKPSILNIGVIVDHPLILENYVPGLPPPNEIREAIQETIVKMKEMGYKDYQSIEIDPDHHIEQVSALLKEQHWDAVVIGGGFKVNPALHTHCEDIINLIKDISQKSKILFTMGPRGVPDALKRM